MKSSALRLVMAACVLMASTVGCGPEVAAVVAVAPQAVAAFGALAGTVWMLKSIENVSLDTEKKRLEIQAIQDGIREVHEVDLSDAEYEEVQRTGSVRIGNRNYRIKRVD